MERRGWKGKEKAMGKRGTEEGKKEGGE